MVRLPVIVGMGGVSPAGRTSCHRAYQRLVFDALATVERKKMWRHLAGMMKHDADDIEYLKKYTLLRRIEKRYFDTNNRKVNMASTLASPVELKLSGQKNMRLEPGDSVFVPASTNSTVCVAGQLPLGFEPGGLYPSKFHPRGLEMAIFAMSDALGALGMAWEEICSRVPSEAISVYAGSAMAQLDENGYGGMLQAQLCGKRVSARHCPFGFPEMPADFVNAYVLGNVGTTGSMAGACASFLYNLRLAVHDIRTGKARVAIVGCSEAPITAEIIEGYASMGALATDEGLRNLDNLGDDEDIDYTRACRPFAQNCGFVISESAQFLILFDDELALETGAKIYGAVGGVFVNADGYKKSIASPGVGNYLTMAQALGMGKAIAGEENLRDGSFIMAHGTGTPQNRVTESDVLNRVAGWFGISNWPLSAVKCYLGHSISTAGGDQMMATLGAWEHGVLPGIYTLDSVADDVCSENLSFHSKHISIDTSRMPLGFINAKGFGGNNSSAVVLSPQFTENMLRNRHGGKLLHARLRKNEKIMRNIFDWDEKAMQGEFSLRYEFGKNLIEGEDLIFNEDSISTVKGFSFNLDFENPYSDISGENK